MRRLCAGVWVLCAGVLAACAPAPDPAPAQTNAALNGTLATEAALLRASATFGADQRDATRVAANDLLSRARSRQNNLISTLEALDVPRPDVRQITPVVLPTSPVQATPTPDLLTVAGGVTLSAPTPDTESTPTPNVTIPPAQPTNTLDPALPRLADVVTAAAVGSDDCALEPVVTFSPSTAQIYVVATAYNLAPGGVIGSRWLKDGQEVAYYEFAPDFRVEGACIWFFVDQSDFTFTSGSTYQIVLSANGVELQTVGFVVSE
jgi:hypothetical protein